MYTAHVVDCFQNNPWSQLCLGESSEAFDICFVACLSANATGSDGDDEGAATDSNATAADRGMAAAARAAIFLPISGSGRLLTSGKNLQAARAVAVPMDASIQKTAERISLCSFDRSCCHNARSFFRSASCFNCLRFIRVNACCIRFDRLAWSDKKTRPI